MFMGSGKSYKYFPHMSDCQGCQIYCTVLPDMHIMPKIRIFGNKFTNNSTYLQSNPSPWGLILCFCGLEIHYDHFQTLWTNRVARTFLKGCQNLCVHAKTLNFGISLKKIQTYIAVFEV